MLKCVGIMIDNGSLHGLLVGYTNAEQEGGSTNGNEDDKGKGKGKGKAVHGHNVSMSSTATGSVGLRLN